MEKGNYLLPIDDGLKMGDFGEWAIRKLDYLNRYMNMFTTAMRRKQWRALAYIDLFSGSGKFQIRNSLSIQLGSPLLALTLNHPFDYYYFADENPENIQALQQRCRASLIYDRIQFGAKDANEIVHEITSRIVQMDGRLGLSLNLAFLDPYGLGLRWETVAALGKVQKMDLIIHYSQFGITRNTQNLFDKETETRLDQFFGNRKWREIYSRYMNTNRAGLHRELIDLYREQLQALGYVDVEETGNEPLMKTSRTNAPLYRLIFASKHKLGNEFWQRVIGRDASGQMRML